MIKAIYTSNTDSFTEYNIDNIAKILEHKPKAIWIDLSIENGEMSNEEIALLSETFKFHELSIEDCLIPQFHPQVEEFDNYIFVTAHGVKGKAIELSEFEEAFYELDMFIGRDFLVTVHTNEIPAIDSLFEKVKMKPQIELRAIENLLYNIFQKLIYSYEFNLDKINDIVDRLEDKVLENPSPELMPEIFSLKKSLLNLRKITEPQKNVYTYFTRVTTGIISKKYTAYFRDIYFQFDRINQNAASYNQIIGSLLEMYVSGVTLKLNEVIKFLTIIATIFMPAVLITSYFGMNVIFPEHKLLGDANVWYFAVLLITLSTIAIYIYFRKKKWL